MRFSVKSTMVGLAILGLAGCGGAAATASHASPPPVASVSHSSASDSVLSADSFSVGETEISRLPAGATSAAYGFNGNVEEVAIVYRTAAQMQAAASYYSSQTASAGMSDLVVTADVHDGPTVVTIIGADDEMTQFEGQFS